MWWQQAGMVSCKAIPYRLMHGQSLMSVIQVIWWEMAGGWSTVPLMTDRHEGERHWWMRRWARWTRSIQQTRPLALCKLWHQQNGTLICSGWKTILQGQKCVAESCQSVSTPFSVSYDTDTNQCSTVSQIPIPDTGTVQSLSPAQAIMSPKSSAYRFTNSDTKCHSPRLLYDISQYTNGFIVAQVLKTDTIHLQDHISRLNTSIQCYCTTAHTYTYLTYMCCFSQQVAVSVFGCGTFCGRLCYLFKQLLKTYLLTSLKWNHICDCVHIVPFIN